MDCEVTYRNHPNVATGSRNSHAVLGGANNNSRHSMTVEYTRQATEDSNKSYRDSGIDVDDGLDAPLIDPSEDDGSSSPSGSPLGSRQGSTSSAGGGGRPRHSDTYYAILRAYCTFMDKILTPAMALKIAAQITPEIRGRLDFFVRPLTSTSHQQHLPEPAMERFSQRCLPPYPRETGLAVRFSHQNSHHSQHLRQLWWCMDNLFLTLETNGGTSSSPVPISNKDETPSMLLDRVKSPLTHFERKSTNIVLHSKDVQGDVGLPILIGREVADEALFRTPCLKAAGGVAIVSERWKRLGFQGCDPATDFRGSGLMALRQLILLFNSYPEIVERIFADTETIDEDGECGDDAGGVGRLSCVPERRRCCEYPFAAACVNISMHLLMLLSIEPHRTESGEAAAATCITAETARHSFTTLRASYNLSNMVAGECFEVGSTPIDNLATMEAKLGEIFMLSVVVMHEHWCALPPNTRNLLLFNTEVLKKSRLVMEVILREAETIEEVRGRVRRGGEASSGSPFYGML